MGQVSRHYSTILGTLVSAHTARSVKTSNEHCYSATILQPGSELLEWEQRGLAKYIRYHVNL